MPQAQSKEEVSKIVNAYETLKTYVGKEPMKTVGMMTFSSIANYFGVTVERDKNEHGQNIQVIRHV